MRTLWLCAQKIARKALCVNLNLKISWEINSSSQLSPKFLPTDVQLHWAPIIRLRNRQPRSPWRNRPGTEIGVGMIRITAVIGGQADSNQDRRSRECTPGYHGRGSSGGSGSSRNLSSSDSRQDCSAGVGSSGNRPTVDVGQAWYCNYLL